MALFNKEEFEKFKARIKRDYGKKKPTPLAKRLDSQIKFTVEALEEAKQNVIEFERDLKLYTRMRDLMGDRVFKTQEEFARYILSLDPDIADEYEAVMGEKLS